MSPSVLDSDGKYQYLLACVLDIARGWVIWRVSLEIDEEECLGFALLVCGREELCKEREWCTDGLLAARTWMTCMLLLRWRERTRDELRV